MNTFTTAASPTYALNVTQSWGNPSKRTGRSLAVNERVFGSKRWNAQVIWGVAPFAVGLGVWLSTTFGILQVDVAWFRLALFGQWRNEPLIDDL
jgi:hypothetical protein